MVHIPLPDQNWHQKKTIALLILFAVTYIFGEDRILDHSTIGLYAIDTKNNTILVDQNSDLSLVPASCMKIVTTAAALHILGSDHCFETHLEYDGLIDENKILNGNLYIRGQGDPCLGSDRTSGSLPWKKQLETWGDAIQKLGIKQIDGKIIGDATRWETALAVPSWNWEDLGNYYGAGACALSFHENFYSLFLRPGIKAGQKANILYTDPPLQDLTFQNELTTGPEGSGDQACIYGSEFSFVQVVRGTIPAAIDEFMIKGAIPHPAACCASLLAQELEGRGISVQNQKIQNQNRRIIFHTTVSPKVQEIVYWTNQKSINLYAEHLLKRMGEVVYREGSTSSGIRAVLDFWKLKNINLTGLNMVDGSGLSRKNLITAKQLVTMLLEIKKSNYFPIFFDSLPQKDSCIRAKSGSMSLVKGSAGYMGDIAFAILINQCNDSQIMNKKIIEFLSELRSLGCSEPP